MDTIVIDLLIVLGIAVLTCGALAFFFVRSTKARDAIAKEKTGMLQRIAAQEQRIQQLSRYQATPA